MTLSRRLVSCLFLAGFISPVFDLAITTVSGDATPSQAIRISQRNPVVNEDGQIQLTATDTAGTPLPDVAWESGSPDVAQVEPGTGVVRGITRGFATITARVGDQTVSTFVVVARVTSGRAPRVPGDSGSDSVGRLYLSDPLNHVLWRKTDFDAPPLVFAGRRGETGRADGRRLEATFNLPTAVAVDNSAGGGVYIADTANHAIRRIDFSDRVGTVLGTGSPGVMTVDRTPFAEAVFRGPRGLTVDSGGSLFIADTENHAIYYADFSNRELRLLAGDPGQAGRTNGTGRVARFSRPAALSLSSDGRLLVVADTGNNSVRIVSRDGETTSLGGVPTNTPPRQGISRVTDQVASPIAFDAPQSVATDEVGNIYVVDRSGAKVVTGGFGQSPQLVDLAQAGSFTQPTSIVVRGNQSFVLDAGSTGDEDAVKVVTVGEPEIRALSADTDSLAGGREITVTGRNFAPESLVVLGDAVVADARIVSATEIRFHVPPQSAPGTRTLSIQTRGGVAQTGFSIQSNRLDTLPTGAITTIAGGVPFLGDGGKGTTARFNLSGFTGGALTVDGNGNLFLADSYNNRIRRLSAGGIVSTVAGTGNPAASGDGGPAIGATITYPNCVVLDRQGNLFIADTFNSRVRRVDARTGQITTIAGDGNFADRGDGGPAISASLGGPTGIALDRSGNLFISDGFNNRIRRVDARTGIITTVAGNGRSGFSGDGGPAVNASISVDYAGGVAVDEAGTVFIADAFNNRVRRIDPTTGIITTLAGIGPTGPFAGSFSGDGGPAVLAGLNVPVALAFDRDGNLLIADSGNFRVRRIDAGSGLISTVAGNGTFRGGDDGPALTAGMYPCGVAADGFGNVFIADAASNSLRRVDSATGRVTTISGGITDIGDGGPALKATFGLRQSSGIVVDREGNIFLADDGFNRVRRIDAVTGIISTVAGTGESGFSGDGGDAVRAALNAPIDLAIDRSGNLYVCDSNNSRIRRLDLRTGLITTVAGNGNFDFTGDGGPATAASLSFPTAVAVDAEGNLFISDANNNRVRKVDARTGTISTIAGSGPTSGFSGDGGPATNARLATPQGLALDGANNLFISDRDNGRVRRVDAATGIITTVAGGGASFDENVSATDAAIFGPYGITFDASGDVIFAEGFSAKVRRVDLRTGRISTVAGTGEGGYSGDGGPAIRATLSLARGVTVDRDGNLVLLLAGNQAVRAVKTGGR